MSSLFSSFLSFSVCLFAISKCDEKEHRKERITVSLARKTALKYKMRFYHRIKVETNKNRSNNMFNACVREREKQRERKISKNRLLFDCNWKKRDSQCSRWTILWIPFSICIWMNDTVNASRQTLFLKTHIISRIRSNSLCAVFFYILWFYYASTLQMHSWA